jgi:hypothetical protein
MTSLLPLLSSFDTSPFLGRLPEMSQWLPVGIALVLGLLLGGVLWRQRTGPSIGDDSLDSGRSGRSSEREGEVERESSISALASHHAQSFSPTTSGAADRHRLAAELDQAQASADRHQAESEAARSRTQSLNAQLSQQHEHVTALANAVDTALNKTLSPREKSIAAARAQTIRLAESLRSGRQWVGAAIDRFATLHRRLDAGEERLWATAEETAGFRQHLEDLKTDATRRSGDHLERLRQRVVEVDEQMRIYHQQLAGCVDSVDTARSDIEPELGHLRKAASDLDAAHQELADLEESKLSDGSASLAAATQHLVAARVHLGDVERRAIEHAVEILERCEWVAGEATHGLRDAVQRFGECDSVDDINIAMMLSRTWRKLSEVGARLDTLRALSESETIGDFPKDSSPSNLLALLDQATAAISGIDPSSDAAAPDPDKIFEKVDAADAADELDRATQVAPISAKSPAKASPVLSFRSSAPVPVRAMQPGDFARSLVGLSAHLADEPRPLNDVSDAAANFREATAELARLRESALLAGTTKRVNPVATTKVSALQAAFENTLLRSESSSQKPVLSPQEPRDDLKRLGAASEDLLSAVALKKKPIPANGDAFDKGVEKNEPLPEVAAAEDSKPDSDAVGRSKDSAVIFCSNDPSLWGTSIYQGEKRRALAMDDLTVDVGWLRLRRLDTGASVLLPATTGDLRQKANVEHPQPFGFHAGNDCYYGAHHLGVFDESVATDVEVRFTYGGWGFGHSNDVSGEAADSQCYGWAGKEIPDDTVFEITVFREQPEPLQGEVVL